MIDTVQFGTLLKSEGFDFYSGVPCSFLKDLINYAVNDCDYVMAANEGDAVAICAGAQVAGRKTVVLMQNSGLGNAVSPLTSLNAIFRIPVLGFVSLRGETGLGDEPQHELMGTITDALLDAMKIDWAYLSDDPEQAAAQVKKANGIIDSGKTFFFIVKKGTFSKVSLKDEKKLIEPAGLPDRTSMLKAVREAASSSSVLLATTGFTGRELYELGDDERNFYMVGSLGCLSSFGLGLSLARPEQEVIVLDGDGSTLMRMGALPVVASYKPKKLLHILLDNAAHESTGGQFTVSAGVDWTSLAKAAGYSQVQEARTKEELEKIVQTFNLNGGLCFVHARIRQGVPEQLGRPKTKPYEVAARLTSFLKKGN
ncbi:phosphonopyruvate decarboxylase [Treponema sp.]